MQSAGEAQSEISSHTTDARLTRLENFAEETRQRLARIEMRLDSIDAQMATKADLHREINAQTRRLVTFVSGFGASLAAATFAIARYVH